MSKLVLLVEGVTERVFVQQHLAPHLLRLGLRAWPIMFGRDGNRGGVREWSAAMRDIERVLASGHWCTTMLDYYGLPESWPGRRGSNDLPPADRARHLEAAIRKTVRNSLEHPSRARAFIPYIQMHEFEALHFTNVACLASVCAPLGPMNTHQLTRHFRSILERAGDDPEAINDGYETCPSRRILRAVPRFKKVHHGALVVGRIGIDRIRSRCRHFDDWLRRLEDLATTRPPRSRRD